MIKIAKEEKSQRMFISLGTFVQDSVGNEVFKVFLKQQLIDNSSNNIIIKFIHNFLLEIKNKSYFENDECELKINLVDSGEDRIVIRLYGKIINNNLYINNFN